MSPENVTALLGGLVLLVGAIGAAAVAVIAALRQTKGAAQDVLKVNADQNSKLDQITVLVNGRYGSVLRELADLKLELARLTGEHHDAVAATEAVAVSDEHKAAMVAAEALQAVPILVPEGGSK